MTDLATISTEPVTATLTMARSRRPREATMSDIESLQAEVTADNVDIDLLIAGYNAQQALIGNLEGQVAAVKAQGGSDTAIVEATVAALKAEHAKVLGVLPPPPAAPTDAGTAPSAAPETLGAPVAPEAATSVAAPTGEPAAPPADTGSPETATSSAPDTAATGPDAGGDPLLPGETAS